MAHSFLQIVRGVGLSSIGTGISALLSVATIKVLALTLGPSGTGFYSLIKQLAQTGITCATLNSQSAIVQAIAARQDRDSRARYLGSAAKILLHATILVSALLLLGADQIAAQIMPSAPDQFALAIRYSVVAVILGAIATFLAGVVNGYRALAVLVLGQICGGSAALAFATPVASWTNHHGPSTLAVLLGVSQFAVLMVYAIWAARQGVINEINPMRETADRDALRHFASISGSTLLTGLASAGTVLAVRAMIVRTHGLDGAGLFDAAYTISASYIGLLLGGFGSYYMPALAATKNPLERTLFMRRVLVLAVLVSAPLLSLLALLREPIVSMLYSSQYAPAADMLRFFIVGDFLKACAWVFAYLAIAFPNMRMLLACDLSWNLGFLVISAIALYSGLPLNTLGIVYMWLYGAYFAVFTIYAYRAHRFSLSAPMYLLWLAAFLGVALASH